MTKPAAFRYQPSHATDQQNCSMCPYISKLLSGVWMHVHQVHVNSLVTGTWLGNTCKWT